MHTYRFLFLLLSEFLLFEEPHIVVGANDFLLHARASRLPQPCLLLQLLLALLLVQLQQQLMPLLSLPLLPCHVFGDLTEQHLLLVVALRKHEKETTRERRARYVNPSRT